MRNGLPLLLAFAASACGGLVRTQRPEPAREPPRIEALVDLGALPVGTGSVDASGRDGRFTPGEWVAVVGRGLHGAEIALDGAPLPTSGLLEGGSVLVRLPPSLAPAGHRLLARSALGQAEARFDSALYVIASDTDGGAIRFLRLSGGRVDAADLEVAQPRTLHHAPSGDSGLLYALGLADVRRRGSEGERYQAEIAVVHLGASGRPARVGAVTFDMATHPSALAATPRGILVVLGTGELLTFSLADAIAPRLLGRVPLSSDPSDRWVDAVTLRGGAAVLLLDAAHNRLRAVSLADPAAPVPVADLALGPSPDVPYSVALASDPADPSAAVVLQGRNLRTLGGKAREAKGAAARLAGKAYDAVLGRAPEKAGREPAAGEAAAAGGGDAPSRGSLVRVVLGGGTLSRVGALALPPDFLPLFCVPALDGRWLVSGVSFGELDPAALDASLEGAARIARFVRDSVQLGKVLSVARDGETSVALQGVGLVFDLDHLPGGELVYSGMRISGRPLPPFLNVKWGVGVGGIGFHGLHEVGEAYLRPPYTYGQVSVQGSRR